MVKLGHTKRRTITAATAVIALGLLSFGAINAASPATAGPSASNGGSAQSGYNAIPAKVTGNVPSVGPEAYGFSEIGDQVTLGGKGRTLQSMSVVLSSWGCEDGGWTTNDCVTTPGATFDVPITFTIYADNAGTKGSAIATRTQTVAVAYRPSASPMCTGGRWYNEKDATCYNGLPQTVKIDMSGLNASLSTNVMWAVSYNSSHYGPAPLGEAACYTESGGCGYDSLNVGLFSFPNAPFAGTDVNADELLWDGAIQLDWTGYRPLGAIVTK